MTPEVSIIIPVFNREKLIRETLDSISKQTYTEWECILVDDGSTDDSIQVINTIASLDSRIKVYSRPETLKKGAPTCRNYGVSVSSGKYIQFFDSDDLMLPRMLKNKVDFFYSREDLDFMVAKMADFHSVGSWETPTYKTKSPSPIIDSLNYKIRFLTPGPLFRASFLKSQESLFDPYLKKNQEWEFYSRLLMEGASYDTLDEVTCLRRIHPNSIKASFNNGKPGQFEQLKLHTLYRMNLNTKRRFKSLFFKVFWKFYLRTFFIFLGRGQLANLALWIKAMKQLVS